MSDNVKSDRTNYGNLFDFNLKLVHVVRPVTGRALQMFSL